MSAESHTARLCIAASIATLTAFFAVTPAGAGTTPMIVTADCQEHQAFVDGSAAAVAARLPRRYTPVRDPVSGRPVLFARAERCQRVTAGGRTASATIASFGVVVESPDGKGCASAAPVLGTVKGDVPPLCNWYTLFWVSNDRRVVDLLRAGTPALAAVYVPHLTFKLGAIDPARGGAPFHFAAPSPSPSPFTMDDISRERPGDLSVRGGYWVDTPQGTVKLAFSSDDLTSGDATGVVHARPGSGMAKLFGADQQSYLPGYSLIAAERWAHGTYRKQMIAAPRRSGDRRNSVAGSGGVQGTVTSAPPVARSDAPPDVLIRLGRSL